MSASEAKCEFCERAEDVWSLHYGDKEAHDVCTFCSKLVCGSGTRWKYVGGGSIEVLVQVGQHP